MFKKIIVCIVALIFSLSFYVGAKERFWADISEEFFVYSENPDEVARIFSKSQEELSNYISLNSIKYLAVNEDNTKQVKVTSYTSNFSNSIINISHLTNDNIDKLIPEITGMNGVRGDIITKNGQKFILLNLKADNDYILTQYITVANRENIVISFYTDIDTDTGYVEQIFENFNSTDFIDESQDDEINFKSFITLSAAIVFGIISILIIASLIKEIRKKDK